jgi:hypothetical protein
MHASVKRSPSLPRDLLKGLHAEATEGRTAVEVWRRILESSGSKAMSRRTVEPGLRLAQRSWTQQLLEGVAAR